jgi:hypothetical protein
MYYKSVEQPLNYVRCCHLDVDLSYQVLLVCFQYSIILHTTTQTPQTDMEHKILHKKCLTTLKGTNRSRKANKGGNTTAKRKNGQYEKQWSTKHYTDNKSSSNTNPTKNWGCSGGLSSSCTTSGTRRVTFYKHGDKVMNEERLWTDHLTSRGGFGLFLKKYSDFDGGKKIIWLIVFVI